MNAASVKLPGGAQQRPEDAQSSAIPGAAGGIAARRNECRRRLNRIATCSPNEGVPVPSQDWYNCGAGWVYDVI